ncbi:BON domain-containing protein [Rhizobiaceae bacterium n13]|uniref:BON domain-containing protein n=1 Tax=Ferirhizobium litorale TaxID=2927786 RepID=A0AAE3U4N7_9HYPH|nr:BON domain-containing protein [Fererhizobium litorale]MDI7865340.1 BON domain-containing protein [Fererhizobium litorale]MDI7925092.1 BON domain-containing protein [Fererhizobium litorale]
MVQIIPPPGILDTQQTHEQVSLIQAIQSALAYGCGLNSSRIEVTALGKFIVLDGVVETFQDAEKAMAIAVSIAGSEYVKDRLLVGRGAPTED